MLTGDQFGGPPHSVTGAIIMEPDGPTVSLSSPNGGEMWAIDEQRSVEFSAHSGPTAVHIEIDRGLGQGWQTLVDDLPASGGAFTWTVTGPISAHCRVRVSDTDDPTVVDVSDDVFTIGRDLSWLVVGDHTGVVPVGTGEDIDITLDSTGLAH